MFGVGAGYSTLYFPKILSKDAKWISIEHDREWFVRIKKINHNPNVEIYLVQPNRFPWTDRYKDGDLHDLKNYVNFPSKFGKFDFILIDGRARKYCMIKAHELIRNNGVVVLHDANREYYHEPFKLYGHKIIFRDFRKDAGGLFIGSKKLNIDAIIDVDRHRKLWCFINNLGKAGTRILKV